MVPAGQTIFPEFPGCGDPGVIGTFPVDAWLLPVDGGLGLLEFVVPALALPEGVLGVVPFCALAPGGVVPCGVVPVVGTHVMAGVPLCGVPCGTGLDAVGLVCEFVPGAGSCGVVVTPGPAALVVIGVGGPMVVGGMAVLGCAGAVGGAAAGTDVCGGVVLGGGAVERLCATPQLAQASRTSKVVSRIIMRILPVGSNTATGRVKIPIAIPLVSNQGTGADIRSMP